MTRLDPAIPERGADLPQDLARDLGSPTRIDPALIDPALRPLTAEGLTKFYGAQKVLSGLHLAVAPGHRMGVVGENGVGKSTLLRLLAGFEEPDSGRISRPEDLGFLHQEMPFPPSTPVADVIADALAQVRALEADVQRAADALGAPGASAEDLAEAEGAYERALQRAEVAQVWDADRRAEVTLAGLGIEHVMGRTVDEMSGGERTRLHLAALLVRQPGALLLDEPTNHLDDEAATFLAGAVRAMPGVVVLASHDRVFLDDVCTEIFDLDPTPSGLSGTLYTGAYSDYRAAKKAERVAWERQYEAEQDELAELKESVATTARNVSHGRESKDHNKMAYGRRGDRVEGQVSRRVRNAQQRLDTLEDSQVRRPPRPLTFRASSYGLAAAGGATLALSLRDVVVPGRLEMASFDLTAGSKLLVTGPNGSGKSTLLHVMSKDVVPAQGSVTWGEGVQVGMLEQDVYLQDDVRSPRELFDLIGAGDQLAGFGLVGRKDLDRPLRELSVGQRRRVVLGMLVAQAPEVLLLDEPTNHISLTLADELGEAIGVALGTIVVASHDRWLRRRWTGKTLTLPTH
ncbi:macrolide transport system ATP-binding/permease protein [Sanguibacter gelidistatuariae]|uniref:Macrolide transport system ATP-binding/permease protein n=1 Tax=Sanguibacter gelidistatuariae TaxID=1814289 RepID=A0A1G6H035_9MICO|nr:ABC-F family ATP-binding cassette domain-containing protein [Sanguibacter gelidistatuariae]SDB87524.1 macrolide transport system ATP-binding/permease protein [Sanguibacter gelidistatuariae]